LYFPCRGYVRLRLTDASHDSNLCFLPQKPKNRILLLLVCISRLSERSERQLRRWEIDEDTYELHEQLVDDFMEAQEREQLLLTLAALICLHELLHSSCDRFRMARAVSVTEFLIISGVLVSFGTLGLSLLRCLEIFRDDIEHSYELLSDVIDELPEAAKRSDNRMDGYVMSRIRGKSSHESVTRVSESEDSWLFGELTENFVCVQED